MAGRLLRWLPTGLGLQATKLYFRAITLNQKGPHSSTMNINLNSMSIRIIPALQDNYMYLLIDKTSNEAAIVDPVDPQSVINAVQQEGANLTMILTTHHHWDHAGGNEEMVKLMPHLRVYGGDRRIGAVTNLVAHHSIINLGALTITCLFTPCHTTGHICYFVTSNTHREDKCVFTGDTLFLGGCGRFFEGTAEQMHNSLNVTLSSLPDDTLVFCGHEYTLQNLRYAQHVEPDNEFIANKLQWSEMARSNGMPTVPGKIGEEKLVNPFMRVNRQNVQTYANARDPIAAMQFIRAEKDNFSG